MSQRSEQLGAVILQNLNDFLIKDAELPRDCLVTVIDVRVDDDLETADVLLSVLPVDRTGEIVRLMRRLPGRIGRFLADRVKVRRIPRISFTIDDAALKYRSVERELQKLNLPEEKED